MLRRLYGMFRSLLVLNDSPHSIALGTAIGLFVAWTPTVGVHMIIVVMAAAILRANKIAGLVSVYISNPLTMVPMYWIQYWVGALAVDSRFTYDEMRAVLDVRGWDGFKSALWILCVELAGPMWLGGLMLATLHCVPGYYLTRWAVERYQGGVSRRNDLDTPARATTIAAGGPTTREPSESHEAPPDTHVTNHPSLK